MNILVVGCGKVGYTMADTLSAEGHSVTVIEQDEEKLARLSRTLDVASVRGNGASYTVLKAAGVESCDVLIAATSQDEVNILCCLIARKAGKCRTVARVRNPDYYSEIGFIQEELGLSMAINPELSAAMACYRLIKAPFAMEMDSFANGQVEMMTMVLPEHSRWCGRLLRDITRDSALPFLIAIVERDRTAIIPDGETELHGGDKLSIVLDTQLMPQLLEKIGIQYRPIKDVMLAAGGNVSYYLAEKLLDSGIDVKIIEHNRARCEKLTELLPRATIIHGEPCNETVLMEEGIAQADAFAALLDSDSANITLALYAGKVSKARLITRINKMTMGGVISDLPIGSTVSPKELTAEHLLCYARAMRDRSGSSSMNAVYRLCGNQVEAVSFTIHSGSRVVGVPLRDLRIRKDFLICGIIRNGRVIIPGGQDQIEVGDEVIVTTTHIGIVDVQDMLR